MSNAANMSLRDRVKALMKYDPYTGLFTRLTERGSKKVGDRCDYPDKEGYRRVKFERRDVAAHRLAWLLANGELPPDGMQIDHINGDKGDNRIINLRLATVSQNLANRKGYGKYLKGVSFDKRINRFYAYIKVGGKPKFLGSFKTEHDAHIAFRSKATEIYGQYARF